MKKVIKLTESQLNNVIKKVIKEEFETDEVGDTNNISVGDKVEMLNDARIHLRHAIKLTKEALRGTNYMKYASGYLIADMERCASGDGGYYEGIKQYIEKLEHPDEYDN